MDSHACRVATMRWPAQSTCCTGVVESSDVCARYLTRPAASHVGHGLAGGSILSGDSELIDMH